MVILGFLVWLFWKLPHLKSQKAYKKLENKYNQLKLEYKEMKQLIDDSSIPPKTPSKSAMDNETQKLIATKTNNNLNLNDNCHSLNLANHSEMTAKTNTPNSH